MRPSSGRSADGGKTGSLQLRAAARRPAPEHLVEVRRLERRRSGQDHVREARGLVEVVVDADHALELGQRRLEARRVGHADDRIAGDGEEHLDLPLTRRRDLLGEERGRHLAQHLGHTGHARRPLAEAARAVLGGRRHPRHRPRDRLAPHEPAGTVELADDDVHHVDEPRRQRAELLVAQPDASVHRARRRGRELACEATDGVGGDTTEGLDRLGRELRAHLAHGVDALDLLLERAERREPLGEEHVAHREEERGVGARAGSAPTRRRGRRCRCGAGRRRPPCRLARGCRRARRGRRGTRAANRPTPAGCRPCRSGSRCAGCRAPGSSTCSRTSGWTRRSWATGRSCPTSRCAACPTAR